MTGFLIMPIIKSWKKHSLSAQVLMLLATRFGEGLNFGVVKILRHDGLTLEDMKDE